MYDSTQSTAPLPPLADLIALFLDAKRAKGVSPSYLHTLQGQLQRYATWVGDRPFDPDVIAAFLRHLQHHTQVSPWTVRGYACVLRTFGSWLVKAHYLPTNPAAGMLPRVPKYRPASYRPHQIARLLNVCSVRDRAIILVLLDTGLRAGELCSMQRHAITAAGRFTVIGKGNKERACWLSPVALFAVWEYIGTRTDTDPCMWRGKFGRLTTWGVYQALQLRAHQAGMREDLHRLLHAFRATFAKNYLRQGGDLESLRALLGHESITMSAHYAQLADDELEAKKHRINPLAAALQ